MPPRTARGPVSSESCGPSRTQPHSRKRRLDQPFRPRSSRVPEGPEAFSECEAGGLSRAGMTPRNQQMATHGEEARAPRPSRPDTGGPALECAAGSQPRRRKPEAQIRPARRSFSACDERLSIACGARVGWCSQEAISLGEAVFIGADRCGGCGERIGPMLGGDAKLPFNVALIAQFDHPGNQADELIGMPSVPWPPGGPARTIGAALGASRGAVSKQRFSLT